MSGTENKQNPDIKEEGEEDEGIAIYRKSTLGIALEDAWEQLEEMEELSDDLLNIVYRHFNKRMYEALTKRISNKTTFKANLVTYRFCDEVWTFMLRNAVFKSGQEELFKADAVQLIACKGLQE